MMEWRDAKRYSLWAHAVLLTGIVLFALCRWHTPHKEEAVVWLTSTPHVHQVRHHAASKRVVHAKATNIRPPQVKRVKVRPRHQTHVASKHPKHGRQHAAKAKAYPIHKPVLSHAVHQRMMKEMADALAAEDLAWQASAKEEAMMTKYQARIREAISQHWRIPSGTKPEQVCQLSLTLDKEGRVLAVRVTKKSGFAALDQAAVAAVWHASPLPIPKTMAGAFEHLDLTLHPESIW